MTWHFSLSSFVIGIMLGTLVTGAWFLDGNSLFMSAPSSPSFAANSTPSIPESGTISVADQSSGTTVIVESVTVPLSGVWVAVREMNGRDMGNILGAARATGPKNGFLIPLLRSTAPNQSYAVQLYRDDNGGAFDPSVNSVYVDFETGSRVVAYFTTTP
ncbi:hypothetical protein A3C94_02830 [Candidatus Kaiserbacteria bacterium RIFCSPHIGHO2_02_FULL_55_17]|uniref:DUF7282 domain-containing protein n=1 Tax=Candidatus Kaiserbacteria bacterium RIFCSPHIGHO2_02_FULL_55_17 TaxID=1798496 RepID=A0A1F6DT37_9BACT|nr:MAG: hypothetical protein A3C94_02830 [Candidatus Kaiserbacteria bacterium RIFCSPHIGHO2_02_FULL_55_17]